MLCAWTKFSKLKNETISLAAGLRKLWCSNCQGSRRRSRGASTNNNFWIFSPAPSIGVCCIFLFLMLEVNSIWSDIWLTIVEVVLLSLHILSGVKMALNIYTKRLPFIQMGDSGRAWRRQPCKWNSGRTSKIWGLAVPDGRSQDPAKVHSYACAFFFSTAGALVVITV